MRTRKDSTRKSGRISGQGVRSGRVDFLLRLAHDTRENRARHAPAHINAATTARLTTGIEVSTAP